MLNKIRKMKARKGFTLVELVVVVAIIAILTAVAAPRFLSMTESSKVAAVESNCQALRAAASLYMADHGGKAPASADLLNPYLANPFASLANNPDGATYTIAATGITATLTGITNESRYTSRPNITGSGGTLTFTYPF